jgi:hypothetical protein
MNFFLDENFPKSALELLREKGHSVFDIRGSSDEGADDVYIFEQAQKHNAVFLTTDRDFFHTIPQLFPRHNGIVVIALRQPCRFALIKRLEWFLAHKTESSLAGKAYLLRDSAFKVYPAES